MVGRLVQQQQVRFFQQQFRQRNPHLPAAGKLFRPPRPVLFAKTQPGQHGSHLSLDGVSLASADGALQALEAVGDLRVLGAVQVGLAHALRQLFHLAMHLVQIVKHRKTLVEDRPPRQLQPILRKISGADALGARNRAIIERLRAGQHLQQRGFAAAVRADQPDAILRSNQPIEIFEEEFRAKAFAGP